MESLFYCTQPIEGIPVLKYSYGDFETYVALDKPAVMCKVSDNESYAIFRGLSKTAKLTVITEGDGNIREKVTVTLEELTEDGETDDTQ